VKLTLSQIADIAILCHKFSMGTSMLIVVKDDTDPTVRNKLIAELEDLYEKIKEVVAVEIEDECPDGPIEHCSKCGKQGQSGTVTTEETFIHLKRPMSDLSKEARSHIENPAQYVSSIYCGYGSDYDTNVLVLTPEQDKAIPDKLCNECLKKALSSQDMVQGYGYGLFGPELTPTFFRKGHLIEMVKLISVTSEGVEIITDAEVTSYTGKITTKDSAPNSKTRITRKHVMFENKVKIEICPTCQEYLFITDREPKGCSDPTCKSHK